MSGENALRGLPANKGAQLVEVFENYKRVEHDGVPDELEIDVEISYSLTVTVRDGQTVEDMGREVDRMVREGAGSVQGWCVDGSRFEDD